MEAEPVLEARATARHVRMSPSKVRIVLDLVRGRPVGEAEAILQYVPRRAARVVAKVIRSAAANAVQNHKMDEDRLFVAEARADEGPTMKRIQPHMRGQAFSIFRRSSHVTIVVREADEEREEARRRPARAAATPAEEAAAPAGGEAEAKPEGGRRSRSRKTASDAKASGKASKSTGKSRGAGAGTRRASEAKRETKRDEKPKRESRAKRADRTGKTKPKGKED